MSGPPRPQPRAGIGDWPVRGDEPPELWFGQVRAAAVPAAPATLAGPPTLPTSWRPAPSRLAFAGFILGLLGACVSWLPLADLTCAVIGAVLSVQARRVLAPGRQDRHLATAGLVLGCLGIVLGVSASAILATIGLNALLSAIYGR